MTLMHRLFPLHAARALGALFMGCCAVLSAAVPSADSAEQVPPHAVVFMYHRFGEAEYPSTNITLTQFEDQLDYLETEGFRIWPLARIVSS